jgi:DNA/RNA-binding domain of Phe-tRNA-synthetase-like protein
MAETPMAEVPLESGWVEPGLREEFRGIGLRFSIVEARSGRSPREVRQRLRHLSDRVHGERVVNLRREPVASSYRIFYRQIGIDPDEHRPPAEAAMLERLRSGHFKSRNLVDDALVISLVETGVAVRAFDAAKLTGRLGLRISNPGERLGGVGIELPEGAIVLADEKRSVGLIFGETAAGCGVHPETTQIALSAVQVPGVPEISVEEAIWTCAGVLTGEPHRPISSQKR